MALDIRANEKKRFDQEYCFQDKNLTADLEKSRPMSPKAQLEHEKRMRREIANSNERRRMQCINAGFQSLRALMPQLNGEKLSKAAILQHTTEYIANIEQERKKLLSQNEQLKRMLMDFTRERDLKRQSESPPPKRKKRDTESSDEGIGMGGTTPDRSSEELTPSMGELQAEMLELRQELDRERLLRLMLEDRARSLEAQLYHPQRPAHLSPSHVPTQMNLKVAESHLSKIGPNVQELSTSDERPVPEPRFCPTPRRNLENLVEAIRQIEGDRILGEDQKFLDSHHAPMNSEDSEKESSCLSEQEDCSKSESSGRDSPAPSLRVCSHLVTLSGGMTSPSPQLCQGSFSEKYPIASHLLHQPPYTQFYRPGVIVHKS